MPHSHDNRPDPTPPESQPTSSGPPVRRLPSHETLRIYRPSDIALDVKKVFPNNFVDWKDTASDQGFLRIRPDCKLGIVGLYGSLAVGNPPSPEDVEAWEASKPKDHWDYHSLFDFISVPADGPDGGLDVIVFHAQHSFQERPLEVVHRLHLPKTEAEQLIMEQSDEISEATEQQVLEREWTRLREALQNRFGAADLREQQWKVNGKLYDITYPDD